MGKGGHAAPPQALSFAEKRGRQPTDEIPFSIGTLRRAIPPHCFERSVLKASAYLAVDLAIVALLYWGSTFIDSFPVAVRCLLWPTYWFCQVIDALHFDYRSLIAGRMHCYCVSRAPAPDRVCP